MCASSPSIVPDQVIERSESHFWIACGPFFSTTLFVVHGAPADCGPYLVETGSEQSGPAARPAEEPTELRIFDAEGSLVNQVTVQFPERRVGVLELDHMMASCGFESGLQHGHLVVRSSPGTRHVCRINTAEDASFLAQPVRVRKGAGAFFPVTFATQRTSMLCFVNYGGEPASVRCRLFCGKRAPETVCTVPPHGSRVLNLEAEFPGMSIVAAGKEITGYVRFGTQSDHEVGVQLLERIVPKDASAPSVFLGTVT